MQPHCEWFDSSLVLIDLIIDQDIFQEKSQNICWFQRLKSDDLPLLFILHDNKLQIFGLLIQQNKTVYWLNN